MFLLSLGSLEVDCTVVSYSSTDDNPPNDVFETDLDNVSPNLFVRDFHFTGTSITFLAFSYTPTSKNDGKASLNTSLYLVKSCLSKSFFCPENSIAAIGAK